MRTLPQFAANPIGMTMDPEQMIAARQAGISPAEMHRRAYVGAFLPASSMNLRVPHFGAKDCQSQQNGVYSPLGILLLCSCLASEMPMASVEVTRYVMLTSAQYQQWCLRLQLSPQASEVVTRIRSSPPVPCVLAWVPSRWRVWNTTPSRMGSVRAWLQMPMQQNKNCSTPIAAVSISGSCPV